MAKRVQTAQTRLCRPPPTDGATAVTPNGPAGVNCPDTLLSNISSDGAVSAQEPEVYNKLLEEQRTSGLHSEAGADACADLSSSEACDAAYAPQNMSTVVAVEFLDSRSPMQG